MLSVTKRSLPLLVCDKRGAIRLDGYELFVEALT